MSWLASIFLVRLAVVAPQALPFLSWQPWCLAAAILGLVGAWVALVVMWYHWVLQRKVLTLPPGTPPLISVFLGGMVISTMSTGGHPAPLWIDLPLDLNGLLTFWLLFVLILRSVRQAKQARKNSEAGSAS
jgi:membrane associated rhomboid family serine protease